MILSKTVRIKVNPAQVSGFKKKGLDVKSGDSVDLPIKYLSKSSHVKIKCRCDVCNKEKELAYRRYLRSYNNGGYYTCSSKCGNEKRKKTFLDKFGTEHHFQTKETKDKIKKTCLERYGSENYNQSDEFKERKEEITKKRIDTFNSKYLDKVEDVIDIIGNTYIGSCEKCGTYEISNTLFHNRKKLGITKCTKCFPISENRSIKEKELFTYIKDVYNGETIPNYRLTNNSEIDVYLPELKLGFEFNGLYWHSEQHKDNNYHLNKTKYCLDHGIHLIHVYEDDWVYKKDIIKSRINNLLGQSHRLYARKCVIKVIDDNKLIRKFLVDNHIQGFVGSAVKLGLYYNDDLVSIMTFGKLRKSLGTSSIENHYELLRFCNKSNTNVVGGASKLFKYFTRNYKSKEIISYADRSWSKGNLYEKLGFTLMSETKPNYYYIIDKIRHHRYNFRKDVLVKEGYDANKTEHQIMVDREIYRIYDSGNLKYKYVTG